MTDDDVLPPDYEGWMEVQGRCTASLIGGGRLGVVKNLDRSAIMKINPTVASMLDGLAKVVLEVENRKVRKLPSKGRVVVNIHRHFSPISQKTDDTRYSWEISVNMTPAGVDRKLTGANIDGWHSLLPANYDIMFKCS